MPSGSTEKGKVYNHDVASMSQMLFRIGEEVFKCNSSSGSFVSEHDYKRIVSYLDWVSKKLDWMVGIPLMDLPESSPEPFAIKLPAQYDLVDSEYINDILRLVYISLVELHNSQSARIASGMMGHDTVRFRVIIQKLYNYMENFVAETSPMDLPESSPSQEVSGKGRLGV